MAEPENPPPETTMEEREELMRSPLGGQSTLRRAHFLKPTSASAENPPPPYPLSSNPTREPPQLKVKFTDTRFKHDLWTSWVRQLQSMHHQQWKKAGIFEAVVSSTHQITTRDEIVIALAERWNPETNTFVFPWGESTLTLEDMRVLGGYSVLGYPVLGCPVLSPDENRVIEENVNGLSLAQSEIKNGGGSQMLWMKHFMDADHSLEHEAFLALWLARFVLPSGSEIDASKIFPLAVHLSRGTAFAFAPAVLSSIYRDLSLLKQSIVSPSNLTLQLWAPFQLLMIWVWERFPVLRPNPNPIQPGDPRSARWHGLEFLKVKNLRAVLDSAGECFEWKPYAVVLNNWSFSKFYRENEEWLMVTPEMDRELVSFMVCIRVGELVGLDCIEQYLPHRVAMQFGYDQDLPGEVPRFNNTFIDAWSNYCRPITDEEIYLPARLFESDVTARYFSWRTNSQAAAEDVISRNPRYNNEPPVDPGSPVDEEDGLTIAEFFRRRRTKSDRIGLTGDDELDSESSGLQISPFEKMKELNHLIQTDPFQSIVEDFITAEDIYGLNSPLAETIKNGGLSSCMKELIQADPPQSVSEELITPENANGLNLSLAETNQDGEGLRNPPQTNANELNHPSETTNKKGEVLSTFLTELRADLDAHFTNFQGAIDELRQEILACDD